MIEMQRLGIGSRLGGFEAMGIARAAVAGSLAALAGVAQAQSSLTALFVANNGNNEGSVTSFVLDGDGVPVFADRILTSDNADDPGNNAFSIDVSPSGEFLAVGHAAGGTSPVRQLSIIRVESDARLNPAGEFTTPATPLDLLWLNDDLLAVTKTDLSSVNEVLVYRYTPGDPSSLSLVGSAQTGSFTSELARHPSLPILYANDTFSGNRIFVFSWDADGDLTELDVVFTGSIFPIAPVVSRAGDLLYAFGGISGGGESILGFDVGADGLLQELGSSPSISPGSSPKNGVFSRDDAFLLVGHGTDSTLRSFEIDDESGALTPTGSVFDVGLQGTLGELAVVGDTVYVTDNSTAIDGLAGVQALAIDPATGTLTPRGTVVDSQGIAPDGIVAWVVEPGCPADLTGPGGDGEPDGVLDATDFFFYLDLFAAGDPGADLAGPGGDDPDGVIDATDFFFYIALFADGCP